MQIFRFWFTGSAAFLGLVELSNFCSGTFSKNGTLDSADAAKVDMVQMPKNVIFFEKNFFFFFAIESLSCVLENSSPSKQKKITYYGHNGGSKKISWFFFQKIESKRIIFAVVWLLVHYVKKRGQKCVHIGFGCIQKVEK
jgi:hypothetical protein